MTLSMMLLGLVIGAVLTLAASVLHSQERAADRPVRWIWTAMLALTVVLTALVPSRQQSVSVTRTELVADSLVAFRADDVRTSSAGIVGSIRHVLERSTRAVTTVIDDGMSTGAAYLSRVPAPVQRAATVAWILATAAGAITLLLVYRRVR